MKAWAAEVMNNPLGGRISSAPRVSAQLPAPHDTTAAHKGQLPSCHAGQEALQNACFAGGVPEALWGTAPPLREVLARVRAAVAGHRLVGHGLAKDLTALGIQHPRRAGILTLVLVCTRVNHDNADGPAKDLLAPDIQHPRYAAELAVQAVSELLRYEQNCSSATSFGSPT